MVVALKKFFWTRLVPSLACLKGAVGLAAVLFTLGSAPADPFFPYLLFLFFLLVFGATATLLILGGRQDQRAQSLGFFFLTAINAWADHPLRVAARVLGPSAMPLATAASALTLHALMPYYLWVF